MGGSESMFKDSGQEINGLLTAQNAANHPNYLAIVNVDKSSRTAWDEVKVNYFQNEVEWS